MKNIRKKLKYVLLTTILAAGYLPAMAQSDVLLNQQWFSRLNRNPAAAGLDKENVNLGVFYRNQWSIGDALQSGVFNADSYIDPWKSNIGISVQYDKPGPAFNNVGANLAYAYRFTVSSKLELSLGLSGGMYNSSFNPSKLIMSELELSSVGSKSSTSVDFGFGTELTSDQLTVGLAITHLGNSSNSVAENQEWRTGSQVYAYGQYKVEVGSNIALAPTLSYVRHDSGNLFELGVMGFLGKQYWAGLAWRPNTAAVFLLGVDLKLLTVGYSYDTALGDAKGIGSGSHEVFVRARISKGKR